MMISDKTVISDWNDNQIVMEEDLTIMNKENPVSLPPTVSDELFPELNELFLNPDKFLSPSIIDHGDAMVFEDSCDRELVNYFSSTSTVHDNNDNDVIIDLDNNANGWSSESDATSVNSESDQISEHCNPVQIGQGNRRVTRTNGSFLESFENLSSIVLQPETPDDAPKIPGTPPFIKMKRDLTKPVSVVLEKLNVRIPRQRSTDSRVLCGSTQKNKRNIQAESPTSKTTRTFEKGEDWTYTPELDQSLSRSAVAARENRQKKKRYVNGLEESVKSLTEENSNLNKRVSSMAQQLKSLKHEVEYLSSVITNQSALSSLLKNISSTPGVQFVGSGLVDKKDDEVICVVDDDEEDDPRPSPKRNCLVDLRRPSTPFSAVKTGNIQAKDGLSPRTRMHMRKIQKHDHDYASGSGARHHITSSEKQERSVNNNDAGVCLHVSSNTVSLAFCSDCSTNHISRRK